MTSDYVFVSTKLCPEAGNDECFVLCNFVGCSMSGFEVIEGALWSPTVTRSEEQKKKTVGIWLRAYNL